MLSPDEERERRAHNLRQRESFDRLADYFTEAVPEDIQARTARIVEEAGLSPGADLLDVGTGTGVLLPYLLATRPRRLVACDLSPEMLKRARARFGAAVEFVQSDVVDLAEEYGPFDAVFCNACFANFYDPGRALRAIAQRLRSGGIVVVSHPLGRAFVDHLREESPQLELRALPDPAGAPSLLSASELVLDRLIDEPDLYILIGRKP